MKFAILLLVALGWFLRGEGLSVPFITPFKNIKPLSITCDYIIEDVLHGGKERTQKISLQKSEFTNWLGSGNVNDKLV